MNQYNTQHGRITGRIIEVIDSAPRRWSVIEAVDNKEGGGKSYTYYEYYTGQILTRKNNPLAPDTLIPYLTPDLLNAPIINSTPRPA